MPPIIWWIVGVGFVAPALALLALFLLHRRNPGNAGKAVNGLWAVLLVLLLAFLGLGLMRAQ